MIYGLILQLDQISLALPSRDYYLKPNSAGDRQAYHKYMTNIAVLLGANKTTASLELEKVIEFERKLANVRLQLLHNKTSDKIELLQASLPEQDRHDTSLLYRKVRLQELQQIVPQINWLEYFRSFIDVEINANDPVVVYSMSYFVDMGKILAATDKRYESLQLLLMIQSHLQHNMVESNRSLISQNLKLIYQYLFSSQDFLEGKSFAFSSLYPVSNAFVILKNSLELNHINSREVFRKHTHIAQKIFILKMPGI